LFNFKTFFVRFFRKAREGEKLAALERQKKDLEEKARQKEAKALETKAKKEAEEKRNREEIDRRREEERRCPFDESQCFDKIISIYFRAPKITTIDIGANRKKDFLHLHKILPKITKM
jgi:hypothetical protein